MSEAASVSTWMRHEQQMSHDYLIQHVTGWLRGSLQFTLEHQTDPAALKRQVRHFYHRITQFHRLGALDQSLSKTILLLVEALHPWPIRWGHFQQWETCLLIAIQIAKQLDQPITLIKLTEAQAEIYKERNRLAEALELSQQTIKLSRQHQLAHLLGKSAFTWADCMMESHKGSKSVSDTLLTIENDPVIQYAPDRERHIAIGYLWLGQAWLARSWDATLEESLQWSNKAIQLIKEVENPDLYLKAELLRVRGFMTSLKGDYVAATRDLGEAAQIHVERGADYDEALVQGNLGFIYWLMNDLDRAEVAMQRSLQLAQALGAQLQIVSQKIDLGLLSLFRGHLEQSYSRFKNAFDEATSVGFLMQASRAYRCMGFAALGQGDFEQARHHLETGLDEIVRHGKSVGMANSYAILSRIYMRLGQHDYAKTLIREALEIVETTGSIPLRMLTLRASADCAPDASERIRILWQVIEMAQNYCPIDAAASYLELASLQSDDAEAQRLWEIGADLLYKIGAEGWLDSHSMLHPPLIVTTT